MIFRLNVWSTAFLSMASSVARLIDGRCELGFVQLSTWRVLLPVALALFAIPPPPVPAPSVPAPTFFHDSTFTTGATLGEAVSPTAVLIPSPHFAFPVSASSACPTNFIFWSSSRPSSSSSSSLSFVFDVHPVSGNHQDRKQRQREESLPQLDNFVAEHEQHAPHPQVGEYREERGHIVRLHVPHAPYFAFRNAVQTQRDDKEEVERGATYDRARTNLPLEEAARERLDHSQQDLGRARAQSQQREVLHSFVPDVDLLSLASHLVHLPPLHARDCLDLLHENVTSPPRCRGSSTPVSRGRRTRAS